MREPAIEMGNPPVRLRLNANEHDSIIKEAFFMINYRKILELYFEDISQRTISSSTGHSRNTVSNVVRKAKELGLESLDDTMTNPWLESFLFLEKQGIEKGSGGDRHPELNDATYQGSH